MERVDAGDRFAAVRPVARDPVEREPVERLLAAEADRERAVDAAEPVFPAARRVDDPDEVRFAAAVEPRAVDLGLMPLRINRIRHISLARLTGYRGRVPFVTRPARR
ncbi:hypothetical protein [Williamsia sp.]|uniref:hypothetical protein n=1 Tax=Williamsia sp. TaxID=1872085 RepID=UPI0025CDE35C|nr:hypothetical protein [Williamsia sp.]